MTDIRDVDLQEMFFFFSKMLRPLNKTQRSNLLSHLGSKMMNIRLHAKYQSVHPPPPPQKIGMSGNGSAIYFVIGFIENSFRVEGK